MAARASGVTELEEFEIEQEADSHIKTRHGYREPERHPGSQVAQLEIRVDHDRPGLRRMWKPVTRPNESAPYDWRVVEVPRHLAGEAASNGYLLHCPICRDADCPATDEDPNSCPGREQPRLVTRCPVCKRIFADPDPDGHMLPDLEADGATVNLYQHATTPEQRLRFKVDEHLLAVHQRAALLYGLKPAEGLGRGEG